MRSTSAFITGIQQLLGREHADPRIAQYLFAVPILVDAGIMVLVEHVHLGAAYLVGLGLAAAAFSRPRTFDVFCLSAVALGLNTLLVAGLARVLFEGHRGREPVGPLLLTGLAAAGLLALTVSGVLNLARRHATHADAPGEAA